MRNYRHFFYYILVLIVVIFTLSFISTYHFYTTAIEQQRKNLLISVRKDIKIIKKKHDIKKINHDNIHIWDKNFYLINKKDCYLKTKEYFLIKKEKNKLEILYPQYKIIKNKNHYLYQALLHPIGAKKTKDENNNSILMAYKLFSNTSIFLMEKIQIKEVIEPYIPTFSTIFISSLIFIIIAVIIFYKIQQNIISKQMEIEKLSHRIIQVREDEKENVSQEIHNTIGTSLFLLKMMFQSFYSKIKNILSEDKKNKKINYKERNNEYLEILNYINKIVSETRALSHSLSPIAQKKLGLPIAIEQLASQIHERSDIQISLDIEDMNHYFEENWCINLYRIIQECLLNITKHSKATQVNIKAKQISTLDNEKKKLYVSIIDNGIGFNPTKEKNPQTGIGILLMKQRSRFMNAELHISSNKNLGTEVTIEINK